MPEARMEDLERRLSRVERENRRLRRTGAAALMVTASLVLMGQARRGARERDGAEVVEASRFVVKDAAGNLRAVLGPDQTGMGTGLAIMGKGRVYLGVGPEGNLGLRLIDETGRPRCLLNSQPDGHTALEIRDQAEKARIVVSLRADGTPAVRLADQDGKERASLVLLADGGAGLVLTDAAGKVHAALAAQPDGSSGLNLMDKAEKTRLSLDVRPDGAPSLAILDEKGQPVHRLTATR